MKSIQFSGRFGHNGNTEGHATGSVTVDGDKVTVKGDSPARAQDVQFCGDVAAMTSLHGALGQALDIKAPASGASATVNVVGANVDEAGIITIGLSDGRTVKVASPVTEWEFLPIN